MSICCATVPGNLLFTMSNRQNIEIISGVGEDNTSYLNVILNGKLPNNVYHNLKRETYLKRFLHHISHPLEGNNALRQD